MRRKFICPFFLFMLLFISSITCGAVTVPSFIGNDMVLQREMPIPIWGTASPGAQVTVTFKGQSKSANANGSGEWIVYLDSMSASTSASNMVISGDGSNITLTGVQVGEVWLFSGQSNMEMPLQNAYESQEAINNASSHNIRLLRVVGRGETILGKVWVVSNPTTAAEFSAVGYFMGMNLWQNMNIPIGLIQATKTGSVISSWTHTNGSDGGYYETHVMPLQPYAIRGAVYYQGESDSGNTTYYDMLTGLISEWRSDWGMGNFPFQIVQLHSVGDEYIRNIQFLVWLATPNAGFATAADLPTPGAKHPLTKKPVGDRLAIYARGYWYGESMPAYTGPTPTASSYVNGNQAVLVFDHVGSGLTTKDALAPTTFWVAGSNKAYYAATAQIVGNTVVLTSGSVPNPMYARHEKFTNFINVEGIPCPTFRDWNLTTAPDTTPPSPNPMTWATVPYATGSTSIAMVATTATDVSGVQYYFDCTSTGGHDSGWQTGTSYTDTGLSAGTQYCYRVQARDNSTNQNTTAWSTTLCATTTQPDTTPPTPNPMTWAILPYATGSTSIAMTATAATDTSGVQYYFDCTSTGGHDSGWQSGTTYTDTGLAAGTQYCYRVQARDLSPNQNTTNWSTTECATTQTGGDTTPPSPNPMTWATVPYATGQTSIAMVATTATDASGVQYFFDCTSTGGHDSAWQSGTSYTDTGLSAGTQYCYRVQARDLSTNQNATGWSTTLCATTQSGGGGTIFFDGFEDGDFSGWTPTGAVQVQNNGPYEGTYHLWMKQVSSAETPVSTSGYTGIHLKYAGFTNGFDSGEYIIAQWYDGSTWQTADQLVSNSAWTYRDITLPAGAANNPNFRIRLSTNSSGNTEWARMDAVEVTGQ